MKAALPRVAIAVALFLAASFSLHAAPAVPDGISYQGYLTNADGTPVDSSVSITFGAYNVDMGGVPQWSQTELVAVDRGLFSVTLGNPGNPFPAGLFDAPVYIGLFVAGEEMLPRRQLTAVAYAFGAIDADTVDGIHAIALDQSSDVTDLQSDVAGLQTASSDNDARIDALEATGADITAVIVGAGLSGGGASGNVTVSVAPDGINSSMLGPNSVGSAAIADGQVTSADIANSTIVPADINPTQNYTFGGATLNGALNLNGALTIDSTADIRIEDNFNGFRWYDNDGVTQFAALLIQAGSRRFYDAVENRELIYSNSNGIGIGTSNPVATHTLTVPSLNVTGNLEVGLVRVSQVYSLTTMSASCDSHGNLACYYGSGTVTCPVGTRVLGGGTTGNLGLFGSIGRSYPSNTTSWSCASTYDLSGRSESCWAICARLE